MTGATALTDLSLRTASDLLHRRVISPVELTEAYLARIERWNPHLNAYLTVMAEDARATAHRAEAELVARRDCGPLHGIPMGLKDLLATAGVRASAGSKILADWIPTEDATVVRRLHKAGAGVRFGRDNPMTGINEKGLVMMQMWLDETRYPPADDRPAIGLLGWIQYNLDRHASVAEVVAQAEAVRPTSRYPIHYLVADPSGDAATLEFLDGKLEVHRGATMPIKALANSTYADSITAFEKAKSNGVVPESLASLDRFVRAAMLAGQSNPEAIGRGFEILGSVAQPHFTRWSVVYDLATREVHFRTESNQAIRRLALAGLDFSCAAPVKMLDITSGGSGDVGGALVDYTTAANRALIESSFTKTPFLVEVPAETKDKLAVHPSATSVCVPAG